MGITPDCESNIFLIEQPGYAQFGSSIVGILFAVSHAGSPSRDSPPEINGVFLELGGSLII
jgi:hypothetical protein